jgi:hypothetical protein
VLRVLALAALAVLFVSLTPAPAEAGPRFVVSPFHGLVHGTRVHGRHYRLVRLEQTKSAEAEMAAAQTADEPPPPAPAVLIVLAGGDANALCRARGFAYGVREREGGLTQTRCTR